MGKTNGKNSATGGIRSLFRQEKDTVAAAREVLEKLRDDYPYIYELLGGSPAEGTLPAVEPGMLVIFVRDGELRFSANVNSIMLKFYGRCQDVLNPWGSINTALAMGDVTTKEITERPFSSGKSTDIPH